MAWWNPFKSKPTENIREQKSPDREVAFKKLQESLSNQPDLFASLLDRYYSNDSWWFPVNGTFPAIGGTSNKMHGADRYAFYTEQDLRFQRDACRLLFAHEPVAKAIEGHLNAFVIGKGMSYKICPKKDFSEEYNTPEGEKRLRQYQQAIDEWLDEQQWPEREQECYTCKVVDGEFFLWVTMRAGKVTVRRLEPEHIQNPEGKTYLDGWYLGVKIDLKDAETPLAYGYKPDGVAWQEIPAKQIIHFKANVTRNVSRGISDFYPVTDDLKSISQLLDNIRDGAMARAEIAYMWSVKNATPQAIAAFADDKADRSWQNSVTRKTELSKGQRSGKAVAHGDNVEFTTMPQGDVEGSVAALQASLRMVGNRFCMPEYMVSADASNANYASTQMAGTPFVRKVEIEQSLLKRPFKQILTMVMEQAVVKGIIPTSEYAKLDIEIECGSPVIEDEYQQAQMFDIMRRNGVISPQKWCMAKGLDYEEVQRDLNEWNEQNMQAPDLGQAAGGTAFNAQREDQQQQNEQGQQGQGNDSSDGFGNATSSWVKEGWEEDKHPRATDGRFGDKAGDSKSDGGEVIGKGSTGDVIKKGGQVHKNHSKIEAEVYSKLKGVKGVANGEEKDGKIAVDYYKNIVSVDVVPYDKRRSLAPVVDKAYPQLVNAITALSEEGYGYNDPLQVGFDDKREPHLFDFSMAYKTSREEAIDENLGKLSQYMHQFGAERKAKAIGQVASVYQRLNDIDNAFMEDEPETKDAKQILKSLDGDKPNYLYYSTNGRTIPKVAQSENRDGVKVIASAKPLDDDFIKQWEITPVIHRTATPVHESTLDSSGHLHKGKGVGGGQFTGKGGSYDWPTPKKPNGYNDWKEIANFVDEDAAKTMADNLISQKDEKFAKAVDWWAENHKNNLPSNNKLKKRKELLRLMAAMQEYSADELQTIMSEKRQSRVLAYMKANNLDPSTASTISWNQVSGASAGMDLTNDDDEKKVWDRGWKVATGKTN